MNTANPTINALEKDPSVNPQHTQFTQDSLTQKPATAFVSQLILRLKTKHRKSQIRSKSVPQMYMFTMVKQKQLKVLI